MKRSPLSSQIACKFALFVLIANVVIASALPLASALFLPTGVEQIGLSDSPIVHGFFGQVNPVQSSFDGTPSGTPFTVPLVPSLLSLSDPKIDTSGTDSSGGSPVLWIPLLYAVLFGAVLTMILTRRVKLLIASAAGFSCLIMFTSEPTSAATCNFATIEHNGTVFNFSCGGNQTEALSDWQNPWGNAVKSSDGFCPEFYDDNDGTPPYVTCGDDGTDCCDNDCEYTWSCKDDAPPVKCAGYCPRQNCNYGGAGNKNCLECLGCYGGNVTWNASDQYSGIWQWNFDFIDGPATANFGDTIDINVTGVDDIDVKEIKLYRAGSNANDNLEGTYSCTGTNTVCSHNFTVTLPTTGADYFLYCAQVEDSNGLFSGDYTSDPDKTDLGQWPAVSLDWCHNVTIGNAPPVIDPSFNYGGSINDCNDWPPPSASNVMLILRVDDADDGISNVDLKWTDNNTDVSGAESRFGPCIGANSCETWHTFTSPEDLFQGSPNGTNSLKFTAHAYDYSGGYTTLPFYQANQPCPSCPEIIDVTVSPTPSVGYTYNYICPGQRISIFGNPQPDDSSDPDYSITSMRVRATGNPTVDLTSRNYCTGSYGNDCCFTESCGNWLNFNAPDDLIAGQDYCVGLFSTNNVTEVDPGTGTGGCADPDTAWVWKQQFCWRVSGGSGCSDTPCQCNNPSGCYVCPTHPCAGSNGYISDSDYCGTPPAPSCGNSIVEYSIGEQCDDGDADDNDCCKNDCSFNYGNPSCINYQGGLACTVTGKSPSNEGLPSDSVRVSFTANTPGNIQSVHIYSVNQSDPFRSGILEGTYSSCGGNSCTGYIDTSLRSEPRAEYYATIVDEFGNGMRLPQYDSGIAHCTVYCVDNATGYFCGLEEDYNDCSTDPEPDKYANFICPNPNDPRCPTCPDPGNPVCSCNGDSDISNCTDTVTTLPNGDPVPRCPDPLNPFCNNICAPDKTNGDLGLSQCTAQCLCSTYEAGGYTNGTTCNPDCPNDDSQLCWWNPDDCNPKMNRLDGQSCDCGAECSDGLMCISGTCRTGCSSTYNGQICEMATGVNINETAEAHQSGVCCGSRCIGTEYYTCNPNNQCYDEDTICDLETCGPGTSCQGKGCKNGLNTCWSEYFESARCDSYMAKANDDYCDCGSECSSGVCVDGLCKTGCSSAYSGALVSVDDKLIDQDTDGTNATSTVCCWNSVTVAKSSYQCDPGDNCVDGQRQCSTSTCQPVDCGNVGAEASPFDDSYCAANSGAGGTCTNLWLASLSSEPDLNSKTTSFDVTWDGGSSYVDAYDGPCQEATGNVQCCTGSNTHGDDKCDTGGDAGNFYYTDPTPPTPYTEKQENDVYCGSCLITSGSRAAGVVEGSGSGQANDANCGTSVCDGADTCYCGDIDCDPLDCSASNCDTNTCACNPPDDKACCSPCGCADDISCCPSACTDGLIGTPCTDCTGSLDGNGDCTTDCGCPNDTSCCPSPCSCPDPNNCYCGACQCSGSAAADCVNGGDGTGSKGCKATDCSGPSTCDCADTDYCGDCGCESTTDTTPNDLVGSGTKHPACVGGSKEGGPVDNQCGTTTCPYYGVYHQCTQVYDSGQDCQTKYLTECDTGASDTDSCGNDCSRVTNDGTDYYNACDGGGACGSEASVLGVTDATVTCHDGIDNDCDGLVDCADSDCFGIVKSGTSSPNIIQCCSTDANCNQAGYGGITTGTCGTGFCVDHTCRTKSDDSQCSGTTGTCGVNPVCTITPAGTTYGCDFEANLTACGNNEICLESSIGANDFTCVDRSGSAVTTLGGRSFKTLLGDGSTAVTGSQCAGRCEYSFTECSSRIDADANTLPNSISECNAVSTEHGCWRTCPTEVSDFSEVSIQVVAPDWLIDNAFTVATPEYLIGVNDKVTAGLTAEHPQPFSPHSPP